MLETVFIRLLAVFLMIFVGFVARKRGIIDSDTTVRLSRIVTVFLYPALIYHSLVTQFTLRQLGSNWTLPAGSLLIMVTGFAVGIGASKLFRAHGAKTAHAFHFQCTINNYIFLPMPFVLLYWGEKGVARLVLSTVGSEVAVWTIGVIALTGGKPDRHTLKRLLSMPMAAIAAATLTLALAHAARIDLPGGGTGAEIRDAVLSVLDILGKGAIPLAMMVAGSRMAELRISHLLSLPQGALVLLRLIAIPAAVLGLVRLLPFPAETRQILTVVAVMPSSIASVILSDIYDADSEFAAAAVLLTHGLSLFTIPFWLARML